MATDDDYKAHNGKITFACTSLYTAGWSSSYGQTFLDGKQCVQNSLKISNLLKANETCYFCWCYFYFDKPNYLLCPVLDKHSNTRRDG